MATTDDNDNQGSSAGKAEISVDNIASENRSCNSEHRADIIVDMTTKIQDSSITLNLTSSRSADDVLSTNSSAGDVNEVKGESKSSPEQIIGNVSADSNERSQPPSEANENSECEIDKSKGILESQDDESELCMPSATLRTNDNADCINNDVDEGQRSECNKNETNNDTKNEDTECSTSRDEEDKKGKDDNDEGVDAIDCEESIDSLPCNKTQLVQDESSQSEPKDGVSATRSETSTPKFTSIIKSDGDESCSQEPLPPQDSTSNMAREQPASGSVASDQNSQLSFTAEPPLLIASEMECIIRLDEEMFVEWNEKRKKLGFGSDAEMAKFMLKSLPEEPSESHKSVPERKKASTESFQIKPTEAVKKKSTSLGGIESIVRRLHKVRSDLPDTSRPNSDNESLNTSDNIKTEPEKMCNISDPASAECAISKKATTAIYALSGRNGRKRVFVKKEPGTDEWNQLNEQQQQVSDYANHWSPVCIKQEPPDPILDSKRDSKDGEKPRTLGQFVQSTASWVSQLVATELEKPQESAVAIPDAPETLFSDSRLHKIIEEQLSKPSEPSVSEKRLHSVIEDQLNKPSPQIGSELLQVVDNNALSKAARKEMKKARREARHAKKLKKAQKKEREKQMNKFEKVPQSYSPYEKSYIPYEKLNSPFQSSTSSSPFNQSYSPFEQSTSPFEKSGPEPVSAAHALESFARMVQIREFKSGGSPGGLPQQPPPPKVSSASGIQKSPPVPTALIAAPGNPHVLSASPRSDTPQSSSKSPAPEVAVVAPDKPPAAPSLAAEEHPSSLFLKSFAQRSETKLQTTPDVADEGQGTSSSTFPADAINPPQSVDTASPLESLLKGTQPPQLSAKSQLEHLLKSKDIKAQWSKPSPIASSQQVPFQAAQGQSNISPHILKVPKVTSSGRTIKDTAGQDSTLIKGQVFDHVLAAAGISSDSGDTEAQNAQDKNKDPEWSSPRRRQRRKRGYSLVKSDETADGSVAQQTMSPLAVALSKDIGAQPSDASRVNEPPLKQPKPAKGAS